MSRFLRGSHHRQEHTSCVGTAINGYAMTVTETWASARGSLSASALEEETLSPA